LIYYYCVVLFVVIFYHVRARTMIDHGIVLPYIIAKGVHSFRRLQEASLSPRLAFFVGESNGAMEGNRFVWRTLTTAAYPVSCYSGMVAMRIAKSYSRLLPGGVCWWLLKSTP
jgi:hypothetical protein